MKKNHEFIIDLQSFSVIAKDEDEAYKIAQEQIKEGDIRVDQILDEGECDE